MADSKDKIIEARNVTVRYGNTTILEDVSFAVERGEIFVIVGGSGSGKSTMLRQLIGLERPAEGTVFIDGENFSEAGPEKKREIIKKFGVLFQSSGLFASMTIAENIALVLERFANIPEEMAMEIIRLKLRVVGLEGYEGYLPSEISGGMKKRAGIARAMALDPAIIFLDEPSSGLDPVTSASIDELVKEINKSLGTTIVAVSHDLASIESIADHVILLGKDEKGIIAEGTPDELKDSGKDSEVYRFFNRIAAENM